MSFSRGISTLEGGGRDVPEHFPELFELVVGHLGADGLQPLRHEALPQRLTDDIVRYQTEDPVQTLLQLGHCATRLVPVTSNLKISVDKHAWIKYSSDQTVILNPIILHHVDFVHTLILNIVCK